MRKTVQSVDEIPLCHGCGLMSHLYHGTNLCSDCFQRRNWWQGGGPLRVVTQSNTYHETPMCPSAKNATVWYYWSDESCMHADLGGRMDKCSRCHSHRTWGFDHYSADSVVIGHA